MRGERFVRIFPSASLTSPPLSSLSWDVCPLSCPLCQPQYHSAEDSQGRFVCPPYPPFLPNIILKFKSADEKDDKAKHLPHRKNNPAREANAKSPP